MELSPKISSSVSLLIKKSILSHFNFSDSLIKFNHNAFCIISFSFNQTISFVYKFLSLDKNQSVLNCGLYYKHTTIVNYASSIINKLEALLIDDTRVIIYDFHVFIVQATRLFVSYSVKTQLHKILNSLSKSNGKRPKVNIAIT